MEKEIPNKFNRENISTESLDPKIVTTMVI